MSQFVNGSPTVEPLWVGSSTLRAAAPEDHGLAEQLFRESRAAELAALPDEATRTLFVSMQLTARDAHYARVHPGAQNLIIVADAAGPRASAAATAGIGRLLLAATPAGVHIVDVGVLETQQRRGHGSAVLAELCERADAAGLVVTLSVDAENHGAHAFYLANGFVITGQLESGTHRQLHRLPSAERRVA